MRRVRHILQGMVQGVGFRPFVYRLAVENSLIGFVENTPEGVLIEIQGEDANIAAFQNNFDNRLPALAKISSHESWEIPLTTEDSNFIIRKSKSGVHKGHHVLVSPDVTLCDACKADMHNPENRRFGYAFTNCTDCGPRYTITRSIPYDRPVTSMACFPLCAKCQAEYENPLDRRFHAQPNACPDCGPTLWLTDAQGNRLTENKAAIRACLTFLEQGKIVAIKGMGGFQLACNAQDTAALLRLRQRKNRPHKAFAVMVADMAAAHDIAYISPAAEKLLTSPAAPIVLCPRRPQNQNSVSASLLPPLLAPDTSRIGIMLPSTPLHYLLFHPELLKETKVSATSFAEKISSIQQAEKFAAPRLPVLVMTSGNAGGEPICIGNRQAFSELANIADFFLFHNRDILVRVDDSVVLAGHSGTIFFRRARGYVPRPVVLPAPQSPVPAKLDAAEKNFSSDGKQNWTPSILSGRQSKMFANTAESNEYGAAGTPTNDFSSNESCRAIPQSGSICPQNLEHTGTSVLAFGAFLKSTFCLTRNREAFVSQHLGDLDSCAAADFFQETLTHLSNLLETSPQAAVCDLHPDYESTRMAEAYAAQKNIPLYRLQHHFSHAFAVLAEHANTADFNPLSPVLGLALDGSGLGTDGTIWGGELLYVNPRKMEMRRLGRLAPFALPGGETAIHQPWRIAQGMWTVSSQEEKNEAGLADATPDTIAGGYHFPWLDNTEFASQIPLLSALLSSGLGCTATSSCGRLFDAISALCGLCLETSYEGQAAIRLEEAQIGCQNTGFPLYLPTIRQNFQADGSSLLELDSRQIFLHILKMLTTGAPVSAASRCFHQILAEGFARMAQQASSATDVRHVVLCGGVINNETFLQELCTRLTEYGLTPLLPHTMPSGDGGLSLGQAFYGTLKLNAETNFGN